MQKGSYDLAALFYFRALLCPASLSLQTFKIIGFPLREATPGILLCR